jgi:hypothetical protein
VEILPLLTFKLSLQTAYATDRDFIGLNASVLGYCTYSQFSVLGSYLQMEASILCNRKYKLIACFSLVPWQASIVILFTFSLLPAELTSLVELLNALMFCWYTLKMSSTDFSSCHFLEETEMLGPCLSLHVLRKPRDYSARSEYHSF